MKTLEELLARGREILEETPPDHERVALTIDHNEDLSALAAGLLIPAMVKMNAEAQINFQKAVIEATFLLGYQAGEETGSQDLSAWEDDRT